MFTISVKIYIFRFQCLQCFTVWLKPPLLLSLVCMVLQVSIRGHLQTISTFAYNLSIYTKKSQTCFLWQVYFYNTGGHIENKHELYFLSCSKEFKKIFSKRCRWLRISISNSLSNFECRSSSYKQDTELPLFLFTLWMLKNIRGLDLNWMWQTHELFIFVQNNWTDRKTSFEKIYTRHGTSLVFITNCEICFYFVFITNCEI